VRTRFCPPEESVEAPRTCHDPPRQRRASGNVRRRAAVERGWKKDPWTDSAKWALRREVAAQFRIVKEDFEGFAIFGVKQ
jgi:hypothetical protein